MTGDTGAADRDPADDDRSAGAALAWIAGVLDDLGVPYQVVGGLAARAHGATRPLVDIDLYVPSEALEPVARAVAPHVTRPPTRHRDEHWDLAYMKLEYAGRTVEIAGADDARYREGDGDRWWDADIDFDASRRIGILGTEVPVMGRERLMEYKRRLDREVDRLDLDLIDRG
jgi:hypothetical protein